MNNLFNPWLGSATYADPQTNEEANKYLFCGRDRETNDLTRLIDNNLFVTLYGPTGVGKSSLLNAGVFPRLRNLGYFPISLRLSQEDPSKSYASAIERSIRESSLNVREKVRLENIDSEAKLYLWNYFATRCFEDNEGREVYPVFVFDQFEEIFFSNREKAELFLRQIYALLNDNLIIPHQKGYSDSTNYRFVVSIREDDLYELEDVIDSHNLQHMKNNRYHH